MISEHIDVRKVGKQILKKGKGFVGRYQISGGLFEEFKEDLWCKGTRYLISPFSESTEHFHARCLELLVKYTPKDILIGMKKVNLKTFYVPMVKINGNLVLLHNELPELTYDFFTRGVFSLEQIDNTQCSLSEFDPSIHIDKDYEFLSINLSLNDVAYKSHYDLKYEFSLDEEPTVIFLPVHYYSFVYNKEKYVMMSLGIGDSSKIFHTPLPTDDVLTGKRVIYSRPWFSIAVMFVFVLSVVITVASIVVKIFLASTLYGLLKLILLSIPVYIVYLIAWKVLILIGRLICSRLLGFERFLAISVQRNAIRSNLNHKRLFLERNIPHCQVEFPAIKSYTIDTDKFERALKSFVERIENIKIGLFTKKY